MTEQISHLNDNLGARRAAAVDMCLESLLAEEYPQFIRRKVTTDYELRKSLQGMRECRDILHALADTPMSGGMITYRRKAVADAPELVRLFAKWDLTRVNVKISGHNYFYKQQLRWKRK